MDMQLEPYEDDLEDFDTGGFQEQVGAKRKAVSGVVEPVDPSNMDSDSYAMYRVIKFLVANTMMKYFRMSDYFDGDRERYYKHVKHVVAKLYRIETPAILKEENMRQAVTDICEVTKLHVAQKVCKKSRVSSSSKHARRSISSNLSTPAKLPISTPPPLPVPVPVSTSLLPPPSAVPAQREVSPDSAIFSDHEVHYIDDE
eukprot:TRINITY_DN10313_c1_g1_i1.p1 TRINITY_DN10313_c1_g1~~TRINITY_DN10313_c1_g1_i1.p1  ORF type:complete len:200 (+),score=42.64 TRINITY_DN10313_c1_g1_i1:312-911(+)